MNVADSRVESNAVGGCLLDSGINLGPDITGKDECNDNGYEGPRLPSKENYEL